MLPLPERTALRGANANPGLVFNKFVDKWPKVKPPEDKCPADKSNGLGERKKAWLQEFTDTTATPDTTAQADRLKRLAEALGGQARDFTATAPFVTGMGLPHPVENGFAWHHSFGCPWLPGSSVKGLVRAWAEQWESADTATCARIFGRTPDDPAAGSVIFFDALPTGAAKLVVEIITPHTGDWRITDSPANSPPADWVSPNPIPFLAVAKGSTFRFAIAPRNGAAQEDIATALGWLEAALEWAGAGAKTALGLGRLGSEENLRKRKELETQLGQIRKQEEERARRNAPPAKGDICSHDEYGRVEIKEIRGDMALVNAIEEGEDVELPLAELRKKE